MTLRDLFRTFILAIVGTVAAVAQVPTDTIPESAVPAEVATALRDRVSQFFQYHVGSVNRRGIDLVAEDTKDYYYAAQKVTFSKFTIDKLEFAKDLNQAIAWAHATRQWEIQGESATVDSEVITTWKQEDGKWVWYLDTKGLWATPMGASDFAATRAAQEKNSLNEELVFQKADGTIDLPADFANPQKLAAQGAAILGKSGLDKTEVKLTFGVAAKDRVVFRNGLNGEVQLEFGGGPSGIPGLSVTLDRQRVPGHEEAILSIDYAPPAGEPVSDLGTQIHTMNLILQPLNQIYPVKLTILAAPPK